MKYSVQCDACTVLVGLGWCQQRHACKMHAAYIPGRNRNTTSESMCAGSSHVTCTGQPCEGSCKVGICIHCHHFKRYTVSNRLTTALMTTITCAHSSSLCTSQYLKASTLLSVQHTQHSISTDITCHNLHYCHITNTFTAYQPRTTCRGL